MKRIWMLLLLTAILLCGCHAGGEDAEYYGDLSKAQEIAVLPANSSAAVRVLTQRGEIADFIAALDMERWELKALPSAAELTGRFQLSQEKTVQFGECAADGALYPVCEILCYKDIPYVTLEIADIKMTFEGPDTAMEYLAAYFH